MIRVTERQFKLFKQTAGELAEPKPIKKPRNMLAENILEGQICDFLAYRGWTCQRQHVGTFTAPSGYWIKIGEKGQCDWRAERPVSGQMGLIEQFEFEVKGSRRPEPDQLDYIEKRRLLGFLATWFDAYDTDGPNSFAAWYRRTWE